MPALFAVVALGLATVGLYGVMSHLVEQRARDIGSRVALGGRPNDVRLVVIRESLVIAVVGLAIGTVGTLALSGALSGQLFGINATDPATVGSTVISNAAVTVLSRPSRYTAMITRWMPVVFSIS